MKICIVIPGHNEQKYLKKVLTKVSRQNKSVVFVDDGSSDKSSSVARKFTPHVLIHDTNLGKGAAMLTGAIYAFDRLKADAVIFMDADDQHDPCHIPEFTGKLKRYQVVLGVRNMGVNMPLFRYLGNKIASVTLGILFGVYFTDIPSGYKGMRRAAFEKLRWNASGYEVETEIAVRLARQKLSFTTVEISAIYHDTDKGMTLLDAFRIGSHLVQWRLGNL